MVKRAKAEDAEILAGLAIQMWEDHVLAELADEFREIVAKEDAVCFIKYVDDKPIAFAQAQLRYDYVEVTESSPVGYLEGIFVAEEYRKCGYATELLAECEKWAKEKNCTEFASDCELVNEEGMAFLEKSHDDYLRAVAADLYGNDQEGKVLDRIYRHDLPPVYTV